MICLLIYEDFSVTESDRATGRLLLGSTAIVKNWGYRPWIYDEI
jgi:hypothetical protein